MPALPSSIMGFSHLHLRDLAKRDSNMGYAIPPTVIVLLIIFGAACVVACAFAVYQLFGNSMNAENWGVRTPEQDEYMREVRHRNVSGLMGTGAAGRRARKQGGAYAEFDSRESGSYTG
ncbi:hypothetical protein K491DRAFT_775033 [Lophiostoma macrostomum CBS 122681]|uniref:Uncharacterized protein n=1 Tax=Lophiostoma macrostomum CBS 122681 TaxID=1314788 RepID=A0A6A6TL42_9PLEO|nr:hypothetical protein K491DRAFT_775033 [Lophiostoma macrostomum CBS 122681]